MTADVSYELELHTPFGRLETCRIKCEPAELEKLMKMLNMASWGRNNVNVIGPERST